MRRSEYREHENFWGQRSESTVRERERSLGTCTREKFEETRDRWESGECTDDEFSLIATQYRNSQE